MLTEFLNFFKLPISPFLNASSFFPCTSEIITSHIVPEIGKTEWGIPPDFKECPAEGGGRKGGGDKKEEEEKEGEEV